MMLPEEFDLANSLQHFDAAGNSCHKFEKSPVIACVADALKNVPEADCYIIVVSDITRIEVDLKKIIFAKSILQGTRPNACFVSLKEYGLNFEYTAEITSKYYTSLKQEQLQVMNPGKYIEVSQEDLSHQKRLTKMQ